MTNSIIDSAVLHNGVRMPYLGLGVWQMENGNEVVSAIKAAVNAGYRSIDTATIYENEEGTGKGIKECGIPRKDLFITTKLRGDIYGFDSALEAFEENRRKLGLEYIDLYLVHWPSEGKYKEIWKAMEKIYRDGLARAIGVSNFEINHLEDLLSESTITPMVNQVLLNPLVPQKALREYCKTRGIQVEAFSPLIRGQLDIPLLTELGSRYGKSPAQIVLRWDLQIEVVTIPKSTHENRIKENADIFDFSLTDAEMEAISKLESK